MRFIIDGVFYGDDTPRSAPPAFRKYAVIAFDAPRNESGGGKIKRGADRHYALTKNPEIAALVASQPLWRPNVDRCSVFCWTTMTSLRISLDVLDILGVRYVTHAIWVKGEKRAVSIDGRPVFTLAAPGIGQRFRGAHEVLLYGTIGKVPVPPPARRMPSVIIAPRPCFPGTRKPMHSAKPVEAYRVMEQQDGPKARRAELFARRGEPGWDQCGLELVKV